jgi:hypothetical protein
MVFGVGQSRTALYPLIRQCAWCRRIADEHGVYAHAAAELLTAGRVTHGLCRPCRQGLEPKVEAALQRQAIA